MCANSLNLFTVLTMILFAARVFQPEPWLNWATVFTPYVLGEGLHQAAHYYIWKAQQHRDRELKALFTKMADPSNPDNHK